MRQSRIDRQAETVVQLARQLRFELLLLSRMRRRIDGKAPASGATPTFEALGEVYAAALARRARMQDMAAR